MELFNKIKDLRAEAFKAGDKFYHSVLTNVFSDVNPVGAASTQTPDDASVVAVVKKHLKGVVETLEVLSVKEIAADVIAVKNREKAILESLLPKQLNEAELVGIFKALEPAALKDFMAHLKEKFAGLYDGKVAKAVYEVQTEVAKQETADAAPSSTEPVVAPVEGTTNAAPEVSVANSAPASAEAGK